MFNRKLKQKVKEFAEALSKTQIENYSLKQESAKLKHDNAELKKKCSDMLFEKSCIPKFNVFEKTNEGIILERRVSNGNHLTDLFNPSFPFYQMVELSVFFIRQASSLKKISSKENKSALEEMIQEATKKQWEYRVFNEALKTEKWIIESSLSLI